MKLPSNLLTNPLAQLGTLTAPLLHTNFLGIDIGTSSLKIVQLTIEDGKPVLETYGEIELAPYDDHEPRKAVTLAAEKQSAALLDLKHQVGATAQIGGIAIPLSSALITFVKLPERDPEQMRQIIPVEAKLYVPLPIEQVVLDWMVISDEMPKEDAFARAESKEPLRSELQDVMLVAIEKKTTQGYQAMMNSAGLAASFFEVELFGAARSSMHVPSAPTLFIDIGASGSKLFAVNGRGIPVAVHPIAFGGQAITENIMHALSWEFSKAEDAKRTIGLTTGLGKSSASTDSESAEIVKAAQAVLSEICAEGSHLIKEAANEHQVDISHVVLLGGGACMHGIKEAAAAHLGKDVQIADPFAPIRKPIILEDVLAEVGPKYAVALGLALRGLSHK
jgi:type IV pilus assembly protein PilM